MLRYVTSTARTTPFVRSASENQCSVMLSFVVLKLMAKEDTVGVSLDGLVSGELLLDRTVLLIVDC